MSARTVKVMAAMPFANGVQGPPTESCTEGGTDQPFCRAVKMTFQALMPSGELKIASVLSSLRISPPSAITIGTQ